MAFGLVQKVLGADNQSGTTVSITVAALGTGNNVFGGVTYTNNPILTPTITDANNTYAIKTNTLDVGNGNAFLTFSKLNIVGGATSITVNWGVSINFVRIEIQEISGAMSAYDGSTAQVQAGPGTTNSSGNITPTVSGDFLYGAVYGSTAGAPSGAPYTAGASYTIENNSGNGDFLEPADELRTYNSVAAVAATFTNSIGTNSYITAIIAAKAAAGIPLPAMNLSVMP